MNKCKICNNWGTKKIHTHNDLEKYKCTICGDFIIDHLLYSDLDNYNPIPHTISSFLREQSDENNVYKIKSKKEFEELITIKDKSLDFKYKKFLKYIQQKVDVEIKTKFDITPYIHELNVKCWIKNVHEFASFMEEAKENKHINVDIDNPSIINTILFKGRKLLESTEKENNNTIFMAFHFTTEIKNQFEKTVKKAVMDASSNKIEAIRVSSSTTDHDTKIDDELIAMIKSSKAVIADFTGNRTAVYYEAGFAMGLGIPVIWTCKNTDIDKLSFDTRQYPHIIWKDEKDLYKQVVDRLKAKIL